ncbi:MAG TPA: hypothetical protein ENN84_04265 [Candidatus Marinimicrobia bacterium]|nr:hypothetical protein [Candidatus Neomarinimicrobiota bacterium]
MKKLFFLLALTATLSAQIGLEYSAGIYSNYVWRGYNLDVKPIVVPDVILSFGEGNFWVDYWGAFGQDQKELDIIAGYTFELNDNFAIEPGLTYYFIDFDSDFSSTEPFLNIYAGLGNFPLTLVTAYDLDYETLYIEPSADYELEAGNFPITVTGAAGFSFDSYFKGLSNLRLDLSSDITVGPISISPLISLNFVPSDKISSNAFLPVFALTFTPAGE